MPNKTLLCENCKHEACFNCNPVKFNMTETEGIKCCQCRRQASMEVWSSGTRNTVWGTNT